MPQHQMATTSLIDISIVDVYDIAASIGKEFEKIIDSYGPETVTDLMPKVIHVLEQLELLAGRNQKENSEITDLRFAIERLEAEKLAKAEERVRYEQELEQIEESWQKETKELIGQIGRLQDQNRRLQGHLSETKDQIDSLQSVQEDLKVITELKDNLDRERSSVRKLEREVKEKSVDTDALQQQLERLAKLNVDYRRKTALTQKRAQNLIQEKADLQAQLHDKEQHISIIKERILSEEDNQSPGSPPVSPLTPEAQLCLSGKMVIDMSDPNRPRFTLNELRQVLGERNELKTKLIEVEEELHRYRPVEEQRALEEEQEPPVQGPINREPDEKLHPERLQESGIKKIFQRFFEKLTLDESTDN